MCQWKCVCFATDMKTYLQQFLNKIDVVTSKSAEQSANISNLKVKYIGYFEVTYININSCYRWMSFFYEGHFSWCLTWRKNTSGSFFKKSINSTAGWVAFLYVEKWSSIIFLRVSLFIILHYSGHQLKETTNSSPIWTWVMILSCSAWIFLSCWKFLSTNR